MRCFYSVCRQLLLYGSLCTFAFVTTSNVVFAQGETPAVKTAGTAAIKPGTKVTERTIYLVPSVNKVSTASRLYPSAADLRPGDAAPIFLRMNFEASGRIKALTELESKKYNEQALENLDVEDIEKGKVIIRSEMRRAVFRQRAGWQYPLFEGPQFMILLPDVQESRRYARSMATYARAAILQNDLAEAEEWILYCTGLARHVSETPFAVCRLVHASQMGEALSAYEDLIQHPASSNYYWDLTSIPGSTSLIRDCAQFETIGWEQTVTQLQRLDELTTEESWKKVVEEIEMYLGSMAENEVTKEHGLLSTSWVARSRQQLPVVEPALAGKVEKMSDAEVGVRYWWSRTQYFNARFQAITLLEAHLAISELSNANAEVAALPAEDAVVKAAINEMLPRLALNLTLLEQRIAMLRIVESIRDWAASHDGKMPKSLSELSLPVPSDPLSGKEFTWSLSENGKQGTLQGVVKLPEGRIFDNVTEMGRVYHIHAR